MPSKKQIVLYTALSGLLSFLIIGIGAVLTAYYYSGRTQEHYSFFNHFISELGNMNYSSHGYYFNDSMMLAGVTLAFYMSGITRLLQHKLKSLLLLCGMLTGLSCSLLGYYSSDQFNIHYPLAVCLFNFALISAIIFSTIVLLEKDESFFPKWLVYAAAFPILTLITFIIVQFNHMTDFKNGHIHHLMYSRPAFWNLPFMEWMVFFSLGSWIVAISLHLYFRHSRLS